MVKHVINILKNVLAQQINVQIDNNKNNNSKQQQTATIFLIDVLKFFEKSGQQLYKKNTKILLLHYITIIITYNY